MSQQNRSYFIQPKTGSDWSSSARLSDQEILNEFNKMSLPSYYKQDETEPMNSSDLSRFQRPSEREYQFPREKNIPISVIQTSQSTQLTEPLDTDYSRTQTSNLANKILNASDQPVEISKIKIHINQVILIMIN